MKITRNSRRPSDEFIKSMLFELPVARDFFEANLPVEILEQVELDSLALVHGTFIDPELKARHTDILYKTRLKKGGEGYIFVLVEHYSSPDPVMAFRSLNYVMRIIDKHVKDATNAKQSPLPLPFVFPVLFYNGEKAYKGERCLLNLFGEYSKEVGQLFTEDLYLVDVSLEANKDIRGHKWASLLSWCMRYSAQREFLPYLPYFGLLVEDIVQSLGWSEADGDRIKIMLNYILMSLSTSADSEALIKALQAELPSELENTVATVGEQLIAKGKLEGKAEAFEETLEAIILIKEGADNATIMQKTALDITRIEKLRKKVMH